MTQLILKDQFGGSELQLQQQPHHTRRHDFERGTEGWTLERVPRLKVGWHPHELLFLAQGPAPYTLVYGSARIGSAEAPLDVVLTRLDAEQADRVRLATIGEPRTFAGADALKPVPPWRRIVLWGVLVVAVAMLALLAMGLFRDTAQAR